MKSTECLRMGVAGMLAALLAGGAVLTRTAWAQATSDPEQAQSLVDANNHLNSGAYPPAKEILDAALADSTADPAARQRAHLLLIKLYVLAGNDAQGKNDDFNADRNFEQARREITRCLEQPELRHTLPQPREDFPDPMPAYFDQVRAGMFGSFRVTSLEPEDAVVVLDGDTLTRAPGELPGAENVYASQDGQEVEHKVVVLAEGYKQTLDTFELAPSTTEARQYALSKACGFGCWALRGLPVAAAATLGAFLLPFGGSDSPPPEPLPGPPAPPGASP